MNKTKSTEYIMGVLTGAVLMLITVMLFNNSLTAGAKEIIEVRIVNHDWEPIPVLVKDK